MLRFVILVPTLLLASAAALGAQQLAAPAPAHRAPLAMVSEPTEKAIVLARADALAVARAPLIEELPVPLAPAYQPAPAIERESRATSALRGFGIGVLVGGATGAILGFADGDDPPGWFAFRAGEKAMIGGVVFGGIGGVAGAIIGAASPRERRADTTPAARVTAAPLPNGGVAVGLSRTY